MSGHYALGVSHCGQSEDEDETAYRGSGEVTNGRYPKEQELFALERFWFVLVERLGLFLQLYGTGFGSASEPCVENRQKAFGNAWGQ